MKRFVEGEDRTQSTLFPERLDDYISEDNPVRVIEAFVDELDLKVLGFEGIEPRTTGRPAYHPLVLLKLRSTVTSTEFSQAVVWSERVNAMSRSCG